MNRPSPRTINLDRLSQLRDQGADSDVLLARIALSECDGMRKTLAEMRKSARIFPQLLPTQASGRWSTTKPALEAFPREFWKRHAGILYPDGYEWWLEWDWSAIEGRLFIAYTGDEEDVQLLASGPDIHDFTCAKYLMAWAPDAHPGCTLDALNLPADWQGSKDERRVRAKNFRYGAGQYGKGARSILGMPGIEALGLNRHTLVQRAQRYLDMRPKAQAWKERVWAECRNAKMSRTFMGSRRLLFGDEETREKDGLNHVIQGSVADMLNWCLIQIDRAFPASTLIRNSHDGATVAFPKTLDPDTTEAQIKPWVEREWEVGQGITMGFPASWHRTVGA